MFGGQKKYASVSSYQCDFYLNTLKNPKQIHYKMKNINKEQIGKFSNSTKLNSRNIEFTDTKSSSMENETKVKWSFLQQLNFEIKVPNILGR